MFDSFHHKLCQVYSIHVQVDTTLHNKLLLLVPDVFCTADKPSQSQSTQAMLPNENRNQWNSMCFLYYTRVKLICASLFPCHPQFGDEADLSWFPLFVYTGWLLWRVLIYQALQWMNRHSYRSVCSVIDSWSWCWSWCCWQLMFYVNSPTQRGNGNWPKHSWSMVCIIGACMSRECVLPWQWAGSMCYHGNEVYLSVLTPVVEEVYGIPWGLGFTPAVEEVCGIPWGLQLTKYSFDCMYVYYKATEQWGAHFSLSSLTE